MLCAFYFPLTFAYFQYIYFKKNKQRNKLHTLYFFSPYSGIDYSVKTINVDNSQIALQMWDTAGQER